KRYRDRLKTYQQAVGERDAVIVVQGTVEEIPVVLAAMEYRFMGGSMGSVVGEKVARLARRSADKRLPLVLVCTSGGARMQEGVLSLMQMAKTSAAIGELKQAAIPFITILTNPTTGGVSASFAMQGDAVLAEPGAVIGFAGQRVIKQTIGQDLPDGFQTAEFLLEHGQLDDVVPRGALRETTARLIRHMLGQGAAVAAAAASS
ncbi:MAG TPA: acetyl-CoA carboxylase carboxyltransferase subunit beta, partial [Gemmatimonadales bacterium]